MSTVILDEWDVAETLAQKLYNISFVNEDGESVYVAEVERVDTNKVVVTTTDDAKFNLICEKVSEAKTGGA